MISKTVILSCRKEQCEIPKILLDQSRFLLNSDNRYQEIESNEDEVKNFRQKQEVSPESDHQKGLREGLNLSYYRNQRGKGSDSEVTQENVEKLNNLRYQLYTISLSKHAIIQKSFSAADHFFPGMTPTFPPLQPLDRLLIWRASTLCFPLEMHHKATLRT
jgi:hypothetical protein